MSTQYIIYYSPPSLSKNKGRRKINHRNDSIDISSTEMNCYYSCAKRQVNNYHTYRYRSKHLKRVMCILFLHIHVHVSNYLIYYFILLFHEHIYLLYSKTVYRLANGNLKFDIDAVLNKIRKHYLYSSSVLCDSLVFFSVTVSFFTLPPSRLTNSFQS